MSKRTEVARIRRIAQQTRKWAEEYRFHPRHERARGYKIGCSLGGICWSASSKIVRLARAAGISNVRVRTSRGHQFVRWGKWLIDVTATQFGRHRRKVEMFQVDRHRKLPWYWSDPKPY